MERLAGSVAARNAPPTTTRSVVRIAARFISMRKRKNAGMHDLQRVHYCIHAFLHSCISSEPSVCLERCGLVRKQALEVLRLAAGDCSRDRTNGDAAIDPIADERQFTCA